MGLTPYFSFLIPHSSFLTPHSSLLIPHFSFLTPHFSFLTPNSSFLTPHSSFLIPHSSLLIIVLCKVTQTYRKKENGMKLIIPFSVLRKINKNLSEEIQAIVNDISFIFHILN